MTTWIVGISGIINLILSYKKTTTNLYPPLLPGTGIELKKTDKITNTNKIIWFCPKRATI